MQTLKFKTNIKCGGCVAGVTPNLNQLAGVEQWKVDLEDPDRILTVEAKADLQSTDIIQALESAGFKGETYIAGK